MILDNQSMKNEKVTLRNEEIEEILGKAPNSLIRNGIISISIIILLVFIMSYFIKYPDIIESRIIITSDSPPVSIVSRVNGKIQHIFVDDKQYIEKVDWLVIIENPSNHEDINHLKKKLELLKLYFISKERKYLILFDVAYVLGEIQPAYSTFLRAYLNYKHIVNLYDSRDRIKSLQSQVDAYNDLILNISAQLALLQEELSLSNYQFQRDSLLYSQNLISLSEFENAKRGMLQKQYSYRTSITNLSNLKIQKRQLEHSLLDNKLRLEEEKNNYLLSLKEAYENLNNRIDFWVHNYVLKAPISGNVSLAQYWNVNQNVQAGDVVITVVPDEFSNYIGKVMLPIQGSGRVEQGLPVTIKLNNYPYLEYGVIRGSVSSKSLVPHGEFYSVDVALPDTLTTSYGLNLEYTREIHGLAEIISEDIRLIGRIFKPFRALFDQYVKKVEFLQ